MSAVLKKVTDGHGAVFFISGEGGIGKSRLAYEFERKAHVAGCKVLVGNCVPSSRINYMPFLEALNGLVEEVPEEKAGKTSRFFSSAKKAAPDIVEAVPILGNVLKGATVLYKEYQSSGQDPEADDKQMLFATLELLKAECAKRPLLMHIDDMQWADSASVGMLHFLARNCKDMRLLILGIYRPEDILLDRKVGGNPFLDSLRIMRREGLCDELTLKPLTEGEVSQVVSGMLERPVSAVIVNRIYKESGGKPLFAVETVRQLESQGALTCKNGIWSISGPMETEIPVSVKEVVLRRIERLSKEERRTLEYASVLGKKFSTELLADSLKMERLDLLESLEALHENHQLVKEIDEGYTFEEEKVRRVTYESISKLRRKEVHRAIGQLLEKQLPNDALLPDLAKHFHLAGDSSKAIHYSLLVGQFCLDRHVISEALPCFELALELSAKDASLVNEKLRGMEGMADCYVTRDVVRADTLYEQVLLLNQDLKVEARVHRKQAECWKPNALGKGDAAKALHLLDRAESCEEADPSERGEIEAIRAEVALMSGDLDGMRLHASAGKEIFRKVNKKKRVADLTFLELCASILIADLTTAKEQLVELRKINSGIDSNLTDSEAMMCQGMLRWLGGAIAEGIADLSRAVEVACPLGDYRFLGNIVTWRGCAHLDAGMAEKASQDFLEGRDYTQAMEKTFEAAILTYYSGLCSLRLGDQKQAEVRFNEVMELSNSYQGFLASMLRRYALAGQAVLLAEKDDLKASSEAFAHGIREIGADSSLLSIPEILWRSEYAKVLAKLGRNEEAAKEIGIATRILRAYGNESKVKEIDQAMQNLKDR